MKQINRIVLGLIICCIAGLYGQTYLQGDIGGMTLTPEIEWIVIDTVFVPDEDTLWIEPGTVIKFTPGVDAWLIVRRGGYIDAAGTEEAPITFTSAAEDPQPGDWLSPMFMGKGPGQYPTWTVEEDHDLGVLQYIKVEYTAWSFSLTNAGSGTTVDHISTSDGGGIYIVDGNVNLSHIAVTKCPGSGVYIRGGYTGTINELFINGTVVRGLDIANIHTGSEHWNPGNPNPDQEPRTNPTITNVTICNVLSNTVRFRRGATGSINNILLNNHAHRWEPSIRCDDGYLLDQISIDYLQTWNSWVMVYDDNSGQVINHNNLFEQDPLFVGLVPTDVTGIGAMTGGDWLSSWGHAIDIDKIAGAGFNHVNGIQWGNYLGELQPLVVPGEILTIRTWYYVDMYYHVGSADLKILFDSEFFEVVDVYTDDNYLPPGEGSVEYVVEQDTIIVSFACSNPYNGNAYLFNIDLLVNENAGPMATYVEPFDAAVNEASDMQFIYDIWRFFIPENLYGDVSMNGEITSFDASMILQWLVGNEWLIEVQQYFGDVSGDDDLTAYDASLIQQYMVGLITEFPVTSGDPAVMASGVIGMENDTYQPGETVEVPLYLSEGSNILSFEMDAVWDSYYLQFQEIQWSSELDEFLIDMNIEDDNIRIAGSGALPDGQAGVFATLIFSTNEDVVQEEVEVSITRLRWNENEPEYDVATTLLVVGIDESGMIPEEYNLAQNFPNPFNPSTTIKYGLPEDSNVSLIIYDLRGNVVQTLESGTKSAGWYELVWNGETADGKTISTGIYFARLVASDYSQVIKMLYLK